MPVFEVVGLCNRFQLQKLGLIKNAPIFLKSGQSLVQLPALPTLLFKATIFCEKKEPLENRLPYKIYIRFANIHAFV